MSRAGRQTDSADLRSLKRSLPMELLKARESAMSRFRPMLREHGLTEQQWRVIRVLAEYKRLDASELAGRSMLLAPSLSRILQFLESEGLVNRSADRGDQRRALLELTLKGRRLFAAIAPDSEAIYRQMEAGFGAGRMKSLYRLLADFHATLEARSDD